MFQNLKTFFKYHRAERNGAITLLILIILITIGVQVYSYFYTPKLADTSGFLARIDSLKRNSEKTIKISREKGIFQSDKFYFDPNQLSDSGYASLGFSEREIQSLRNYMKAGASFRIKSDFAKLYFLSDSEFVALEPYIDLPVDYPKKKYPEKKYDGYKKYPKADKYGKDTTSWSDTAKVENYTYKKFTCDLNYADTTTLKKLFYIGPFYAKKIVEYRAQLGGFYDLRQLLELYEMTPETIDKFADQVTIDLSAIQKLNVNTATSQELAAHPYISFKLASQIILKRESRGKFKNMQDLCESGLLNDELCIKLAPYLKF